MTRARVIGRWYVGLWFFMLLSGCGGGDEMSPTPTAPAAPTLRSIAIAGPANLEVGATSSLTASGTYSDSTTQDVTRSVTWSSSTPANCSVDGNGLLMALSAGNCDARASLSGVAASKVFEVRSPLPARLVEIRGLVHETAPTSDAPVPGATIEILDGALKGRRFPVDASGRFSLPPLPEVPVAMHVSAEGYLNDVYYARDFPRDASVDVALMPEPGQQRVELSGSNQCALPESPLHPLPYGSTKILANFGVHHSGQVVLDTASTRFPFFEVCFFVLRRTMPSGAVERIEWQYSQVFSPRVEAGFIYALEVFHPMLGCTDGFIAGPYRLTFRHPR